MRRTWLVGGTLIVATVVVVALSAWFDLELESTALFGVAVGAVVALVPDRSPAMRLIGLLAGFVAAWIGYLVRAGFLPDSVAGRCVGLGLVVLLCVLVAGLSFDRVPLWATLLGAAGMVGAYEAAYTAAPPEVVSTSFSTATALLMTLAVGFLAGSVLPAAGDAEEPLIRRPRTQPQAEQQHSLDDMMETAK
jgi:hypothetical protein